MTLRCGQGDLLHLAHVLSFPVPWCRLSFGDMEGARAAAQEAAEIGTRIGEHLGLSQAAYALACIDRWRGDYAAALEHLQTGLTAAQQMGLPFFIAIMLGAICGTTVEMDPSKLEETLPMHAQALQLLEHPMGVLGGGCAWADLGECALVVGQPATARSLFEKGLTVRTPFMFLQKPRFLAGLARVALQEGNPQGAQLWAEQAYAWVHERQMAWMQPAVELTRADVYGALARPAEARDSYRAAAAHAADMGMRPLAERLAVARNSSVWRLEGRFSYAWFPTRLPASRWFHRARCRLWQNPAAPANGRQPGSGFHARR